MKSTSPALLSFADAPRSAPLTTRLASARSLRAPVEQATKPIGYRGLQELLAQVPTAIYLLRGPAYVIDLVSPPAAAEWGRPVDEVRGKPFFEALPYLRGQGYEAAYATVWQTQQAVTWREAPITGIRQPAGQLALGYFDVSFQPLEDEQGRMTGILVTSQEITEQVVARQRVHQATAKLAATPAGPATYATEVPRATHIAQGHAELRAGILAQLLEQAPLAAGLFVGADYVVEVCNPGLQALWGCPLAQVLHRPLLDVLPGSQGQSFRRLLDRVGRLGTPSVAHQLPGQGELETASTTFIYYPLRDARGGTTAIAAVATAVGERMEAGSRSRATRFSSSPLYAWSHQSYTRHEVSCELTAQKVLNLRHGIAPEST